MKPSILVPALGLALLIAGCATSDRGGSDRFVQSFKSADANGDNKVTLKEFEAFTTEEAFALFDSNKDGFVTEREFVAAGGTSAAFRRLDRTSDGRITLDEALAAQVVMSPREAIFYAADVNKDGMVTLGEAVAYRDRVREITRG